MSDTASNIHPPHPMVVLDAAILLLVHVSNLWSLCHPQPYRSQMEKITKETEEEVSYWQRWQWAT